MIKLDRTQIAYDGHAEELLEDRSPLVSVVMPLFNAEAYISETLASVQAQTYPHWELIVIDDGSTDASYSIVSKASKNDSRIRPLRNSGNMGVAKTRNRGVAEAKGRFLAFLDADDVWMPNKLARQIDYMVANRCPMCFTSYETIEADGSHRNYVHVPETIDYRGFLKNTVTCSHTIMFDLSSVSKQDLLCPDFEGNFDYPEDMVVWLRVLKTGIIAHGLHEVLAKNRKHGESRSSDKRRAVSRTWNAYRRIEHLNVPHSAYCLFWQLFHAVLKRL